MFKKRTPSSSKSASTAEKTSQKHTPAMISGEESERFAEQFLLKQGLKLVMRNYRCKAGEIDLIMRDREHLVFVEVRYRKSGRFGSASETVDSRKQQKLIRAAQHYLQTQVRRQLPACRFDVVAIQGCTSDMAEKHTTNAQHPTNSQYSSTNRRQNPIEWIPNAFTL